MPERVRRARAGDADAVCDALAEAFGDYAWTRWTVDAGDHVARIESLQRLIVEQVALPYREVWIAEDERGVASAAIWMLPTSSVPASVWEAIAPAQTALEGNRHEASVRAEAAVAHLRPSDPHYYLGAVGTRSDRQRRGLAAAVLAPILERADTAGAIGFLETSAASNVSFYKRLGFVVTGEVVKSDDVLDQGSCVPFGARCGEVPLICSHESGHAGEAEARAPVSVDHGVSVRSRRT